MEGILTLREIRAWWIFLDLKVSKGKNYWRLALILFLSIIRGIIMYMVLGEGGGGGGGRGEGGGGGGVLKG